MGLDDIIFHCIYIYIIYNNICKIYCIGVLNQLCICVFFICEKSWGFFGE